MKTHTDADIEQVNQAILARRAEREAAAVKPPEPVDGQQPRMAVDLTGLTANDFRPGMPALTDAETAEWIQAYRAGYSRFAHDPQGEAIITLMEKRLADALKADGKTLPPFYREDRLKALRIAAAARGNGIR
jgi:hypothetical protein